MIGTASRRARGVLEDDLADPRVLDDRAPLGGGQGRRLVEDLHGDGDLPDVMQQRRHADPVDLGVGQLQLVTHLDDDRRDQRRRLAAIVGERRDVGGQHVRRGIAGSTADLHRPGPPGVGDRGPRHAGVLVGFLEDVGLVASERLRRVHRRVGVSYQVLHPELLPGAADDADRDRDRQVGVALDVEPLPARRACAASRSAPPLPRPWSRSG